MMKQFVFLLLFFPLFLSAQTNAIEPVLFYVTENNLDKEVDLTEIQNDLAFVQLHPINLNTCSASELNQLWILSDIQINNLIYHRQRYGGFLSFYELHDINGFSKEVINLIIPFLCLDREKANRSGKYNDSFFHHQLLVRSNLKLPLLNDSSYLGSALSYAIRYHTEITKNTQFGLNMDKDAGERWRNPQSLTKLEYVSAFVAVAPPSGIVQQLIVGDFNANFGQGLTLSNRFSFGFGNKLDRIDNAIKPHHSFGENYFWRGLACQLGWKKIDFSTIVSYRNLDASLSTDSSNVLILINSGYHRTQTELEKTAQVNEFLVGGNINYQTNKTAFGITAHTTYYSKGLEPVYHYYNPYPIKGKQNSAVGIYVKTVTRKNSLFGESAYSMNGGFALIGGFNSQLTSFMRLSMLYRNYSVYFQNQFCTGYSNSSNPQGERGMVLLSEMNVLPRLTTTLEYDLFQNKLPAYLLPSPLKFASFKLKNRFILHTSTILTIGYSYKLHAEVGEIAHIVLGSKENFKAHLKSQITDQLLLETALEYVLLKNENASNDGVIAFIDLKKQLGENNLLGVRYCFWETSGYDSRIYIYENNVLGYYYTPAFYGIGERAYLIFTTKTDVGIEIQAKLACERKQITNLKKDFEAAIFLQLIYRF